MKAKNIIWMLCALLGQNIAQAADRFDNPPPEVKEVIVRINDAYVPSGFDSESESYVVVNGLFPNSCYQWKDALVVHKNEKNLHDVRAMAVVKQGLCLMVLIPYTKEVKLGKLKSGDHMIRFENGDGTYFEKPLHID